MAKQNNLSKIASKIYNHCDKDEIMVKLISNVSSEDISEWLCSKYADNEKQFRFSKKEIDQFRDNYLDFYSIIKDDVGKVKSNLTTSEELRQEIQGSAQYHKALEKYVDGEVDIKVIVKKMVANIENRASQVFDQIQDDPMNTKIDRVLIEWFNTLISLLEKYDPILNGSPDQINIQNNINIQVVDDHINVVYNIIKEILSKLDYDTSILFIEMFNEEMSKIKSTQDKPVLPQEIRISDANKLSASIAAKLDKQ